MATRRSQQNHELLSSTTEKDISSSSKPSDTSPAVPTDVIIKLLAFSVAMIGGPIGMYFLTVNTIFSGNATFAGATAAITANVVLFAYIFVAWQDDQEEQHARKEKKAQ